MKNVFPVTAVSLALIMLIITAVCLSSPQYSNAKHYAAPEGTDHSLAKVKQIEGIYVFINCTPESETEYLGNAKVNVAWSGKTEEMIKITLKKAVKDFPKCDAIIFQDNSLEKADVVKFK